MSTGSKEVMQQYQHPSSPTGSFSNFSHREEEIDLFEIFNALWVSKVKIIAISLLFAVAATINALNAQQWWSSKAIIIPAQLNDFSEYQYQVKQFQPVFDVYQQDGTILVNKELKPLIDNEKLFQQFINSFNSLANKKAFLLSSEEFKSYLAAHNISGDEALSRTLDAWFEKIKATQVDTLNDEIYTLSLQATTDESSFVLLNSYIAFVSAQVFKDNLSNLRAVTQAKENELKQMLTIFEAQALNYIDVEKQRSLLSLDIAKAANLEQPLANITDNKLFDIQLGSNALQAKVKALDSIDNLGVVDPNIQQIRAKLSLLKSTKINADISFKTFRFLENVEMPLGRDKPKRALIVILSTIFGGVLGVAMVLIQFTIAKRKKRIS
ncbi:LPS O-antigen chain length determinant protein WzzB [Photobacterium sanguinicancri]|uniref:Wzz/FepE/Etk N-terminal domain-containing protein n=1 Tax=Photobacterium sanguinicancri TaxID=875932 RepID=A0AAW7Y657_9GAMM|nr:Wzz/FepE/Etk N-terminal domain-containing protein [Photobacterium sanguinicancri]MDO6542462.1 Wzz/FepE/Etk N-terminal domain-containing protein [Photobacterium sanguinicancri]